MLKKIWFIVQRYPTKEDPVCAYIRPVVAAIADMGIQCTVISAQSITHTLANKEPFRPYEWYDETENHHYIRVIQPRYVSVSSVKVKGLTLSYMMKMEAIKKAISKLDETPDVVYAHFWDLAMVAAMATNFQYPLITVSGEERIDVLDRFPKKYVKKLCRHVNGVICVSSKNLRESKELGLVRKGLPTIVLPNSIENQIFHPMDQLAARKELGLDPDCKIAAFVGAFIERKGALRLAQAARKIPDLKLIFIGKGDQKPVSDQILFCGELPHKDIPTYLNAADFFVLPTLAEGCCNAIVEALACGLPVISSKGAFNDDILEASNSLRVDPMNIHEIAQAMSRLYQDEDLRKKLSQGAWAKAQDLTIPSRTRKIVDFIDNAIKIR